MADNTNISTNITGGTGNVTDGQSFTIEELNDMYIKQKIGGIVFVTLLMIIGVIGNAHVLYLFAFKFPKTNHRIYILSLAVLDMITCSVGMPFVIVDLQNTLTFESAILCKLLRFVNYFNSGGSAFTLVVIAVDRYKKICNPLGKQMNERMAKIACCIALSISLMIAWPAPVLYGKSTVDTSVDGITGVACFTEDRFKKTKYQLYFNSVLILVVFGSFVTLIVLYALIGRRILKQSKKRTKMLNPTVSGTTAVVEPTSSSNSGSGTDNSNDTLSTDAVICTSRSTSTDEISKTDTLQMTATQQHNETAKKTPSGNKSRSNIDAKKNAHAKKTKRTTLMLFIITLVFIISFAPHLALKITVFLNKKFLASRTFAELFLYHTFVWSFFINNMANPIIYGFCDPRFRREIRNMYGHLLRKQYKASVV
ncbi:neuropeptide S receptor-like [Mizuhopecten yessoensis]|uniref:Orexin receptor type 2 n=1 Tax=Mizuhopecten yessoensis TaxID=6573 RepID=A0A210PXV4_MIZYE|nr:neuropeptide S receptor-like [Mizuhopecten yessoensis]OWF41311.1 Orexin receptor type 2 [Mizuhopecten yessoensis]